jgi:hypothetical protein
MTTLTLYFRNEAERRAVAWFKRSMTRGKWLSRALEEVAYNPSFKSADWRRGHWGGFAMQGISRGIWVDWMTRPYGHTTMNQTHQLALLCIRRNVHFPDMARKLAGRAQ